MPIESCQDSGETYHPRLGYWSTTRRRQNPSGMLRFSPLSEGGADASTEVLNASSARSLTAQMGLWSERPQDGPQLTAS